MRKTMKLASLVCLVLLVFALMFTACDVADEPQTPDDMMDETTLDSVQDETPDGTHKPGGETHVHSYGEWIITRESTCSAQGSKERICDCGAKV